MTLSMKHDNTSFSTRWRLLWLRWRMIFKLSLRRNKEKQQLCTSLTRDADDTEDTSSHITPPTREAFMRMGTSSMSIYSYLDHADDAYAKLHVADNTSVPEQSLVSALTMDAALSSRLGMDMGSYVQLDTDYPLKPEVYTYEHDFAGQTTDDARPTSPTRLDSSILTLDDQSVYTSPYAKSIQEEPSDSFPREELSVVAPLPLYEV